MFFIPFFIFQTINILLPSFLHSDKVLFFWLKTLGRTMYRTIKLLTKKRRCKARYKFIRNETLYIDTAIFRESMYIISYFSLSLSPLQQSSEVRMRNGRIQVASIRSDLCILFRIFSGVHSPYLICTGTLSRAERL